MVKGSLTDEEQAAERVEEAEQQPGPPELEEGDDLLDELLDLHIAGTEEEKDAEKPPELQALPPKTPVEPNCATAQPIFDCCVFGHQTVSAAMKIRLQSE